MSLTVVRNGPNLILEMFGVIGDTWDLAPISDAAVSAALRDTTGDVAVWINSEGGDAVQGLAIYRLLKAAPNKVTTHNIALAASAASVIMMAGDEIVVDEGALTMVHRASTGRGGNTDDMQRAADVLDAFDTSIVSIYVARTGLAESKIRKLMAAETWMTSAEAKELGFATRIDPAKGIAARAYAGLRPVASRATNVHMTIAERLGLPKDASEEQIAAALDALIAAKPVAADTDALVQAAVKDALAAQAAAAAVLAPVQTVEELHSAAVSSCVERFIAAGKIVPAQREKAVAACGKSAHSLSAASAYWESAPAVVAPVRVSARTEQDVTRPTKLTALQARMCRDAGITPEQFLASKNGDR